MAHRPEHQTVGASLGAFLNRLGQRQLAEGERSRAETRAEDLRLRVINERLGEEGLQRERDKTSLKRQNQISIALRGFREPRTKKEFESSRDILEKAGFEIPAGDFIKPIDPLTRLRRELELKAKFKTTGRGGVKPKVGNATSQVNAIIKAFNDQRKSGQTNTRVDFANVSSAIATLDALRPGDLSPAFQAQFEETTAREQSRVLGDLHTEFFRTDEDKNRGLGGKDEGFADRAEVEAFIELAVRDPLNVRVVEILQSEFISDAVKGIIADRVAEIERARLEASIPAPRRPDTFIGPSVSPKKNRFF